VTAPAAPIHPAAATDLRREVVLRTRLDSLDLVRGLVMVIMALDHVRDFFHHDALLYDPTDLTRTTPLLFFTRWITHLCAPTFVFLAGLGAWLYGSRGRSRGEVARFLLSRGVWLVVIELTLVRFALCFNFDYNFLFLQVIWAIGWSMVALAGLVFLPRWAVLAVGVVMIAGHNVLDGMGPAPFASVTPGTPPLSIGDWLWSVVHVPNPPVIYPLIPWIGVMAVGYGLGPVAQLEPVRRRRLFVQLGLALTAGFIVLRAVNRYGDPAPWSTQPSLVYTVLAFLNTSKYPPSLLYLLMTLGPALVLLGLFDRAPGPIARFFITFGRVPFFFYILHFYLIHLLALAAAALTGFDVRQFLTMPFLFPPEYGFSLGVAYLVWLGVVLALYWPCRWFAALKARRSEAWLSYL
jgi:uncharacterized membrane protein